MDDRKAPLGHLRPRNISTVNLAKSLIYLITLALFVAEGEIRLEARTMRLWTYQDLLNASDVVALVEPIANENNNDSLEPQYLSAQGVTTTFRVLCFLKGGVSGASTIRVKHFLYKSVAPANGGTMINFLIGPLDIDATFKVLGKSEAWKFPELQPHWLAFLKKMPDGFFAPTGGQFDPDLSFRELHDVSMFDPSHGMLPAH
jgi:hypothetical protein